MKKLTQSLEKSMFFGWFICLLGALFYTYEYMLRIEPGIMVHDLKLYFSLGAGGVGLLASAYYWAYTPLQLLVGLILDRFGARRVLLSALIACVLGTFIFGFTKIVWIAGGGRFLVGLGSAFAFVGSLKLAADWLPKRYFAFFAGLCTSLGMVGAMFGETAMSYIVDHLGWHPVITDSLWLGLILFGIFFICVFQKSDGHATKTIEFRLLFRNVVKILSSKTILLTGFIGCSLYLSLSVLAEQWGNSYIQEILNVNTQGASYFVDMIFLGWLIGSPLSGILSEKFKSRKRVLMLGCILSFIVILPLIFCPLLLSRWSLAGILLFFGIFCSAEINCFAVAHDWVDNKLTATAVGLMNACIMVGGMLIQPFFAYCLDFFSHRMQRTSLLQHHSVLNYQLAMIIIPVFLIVSFLMTFFIKESYNVTQS